MEIENYFKRQKRIYLFYTLLPIFLLCEVMIFVYTASTQTNREILYALFAGVCIIEFIIILVQVIIKIGFRKQINELSEEEKLSFQKRPLLVGPILVNEAFVVEYRMFEKRIIPISDIIRANYKEEHTNSSAGAIRVSLAKKTIILHRHGKEQIEIEPPALFIGEEPIAIVNSINNVVKCEKIREGTKDIYDEYDGDYPFSGMFVLILLGLILLLYRGYYPFMNIFIDKKDKIEYFLFHAGYDKYFQMGAIAIICLYTIISFIWKVSYWGFDGDSNVLNFVTPVAMIALFFLYISFVKDYGDISMNARKDFQDYKIERYESIESNLRSKTDYYTGHLWYKNMVAEFSTKIYTYSSEEGRKFILLDNEYDIDKEERYKIEYLKNTGIIVSIQKK